MKVAFVLLTLALTLGEPRDGGAQEGRAAVDGLANAYSRAQLDRFPEAATINGFAGPRNGRLMDLSPEGFAHWDEQLRRFQRTAASIDPKALD
jgi:hypothetical protein